MPNAEVQLPNEMRKPPIPRLPFGIWQSAVRQAHGPVFDKLRPRAGRGERSRRAFGIRPRRAFTLVELMLSLAMVLLLILGINYVFRSATDAVSAGQALNAINDDAQATGPMLFNDLANVSKNPPCFIIASQLVTQFLNSDDAKTSSDPTVIPIDNAGNYDAIGGQPPNITSPLATQIISPAILNSRNHRADLLKFFAHANYHRRSGNDGTFTGSESSDDAYIEIGHAALPANDLSNFYGPSGLPNITSGLFNGITVTTGVPRVGAYASDWVLARRLTLLISGSPVTNPDTPPNPQTISNGDYYYGIITPSTPVPPSWPAGSTPYPKSIERTSTNYYDFGANMSPLSYGTTDYYYSAAGTPFSSRNPPEQVTESESSRYDVGGVTPDQFDRIIANAILTWQAAGYQSTSTTTPASLWWNPLVYTMPIVQTAATAPQYATSTTPPYAIPYLNAVPAYTESPTNAFKSPGYTAFPPYIPLKIDPGLWLNRPQCNPLIQTPVTAAALAEMAPFFLQHCSQFIVEYAGDYMQQNPATGDMTGVGPDGQIDFYLDANGNKHIRWYGMPRSSTGIPHLDGPGAGAAKVLIRGYDYKADSTNTTQLLNYFTDVIPLRDYYTMWFDTQSAGTPAPGTTIYAPPWEADVNFDPTHDYAGYSGLGAHTPPYIPTAYTGGGNKIFFGDFNNPPRYVAAWHDDMPAMIRILIKVDDPNNKVKDGPWYEYVFRLK